MEFRYSDEVDEKLTKTSSKIPTFFVTGFVTRQIGDLGFVIRQNFVKFCDGDEMLITSDENFVKIRCQVSLKISECDGNSSSDEIPSKGDFF